MFFQLKPGGMAEVEITNNSNKMDSFFIRVMRGWITSGQKIQHFAMDCKRNYTEGNCGRQKKRSGAGIPIHVVARRLPNTPYSDVLTGVALPEARSTGMEICSCTISHLPLILR